MKKQLQKEFTKKEGRWMMTISSIFYLIMIELIKLILLLPEKYAEAKIKLLILAGIIGPILITIIAIGGILIWIWCEE